MNFDDFCLNNYSEKNYYYRQMSELPIYSPILQESHEENREIEALNDENAAANGVLDRDTTLAESIQKYPELYSKQHHNYFNNQHKHQIWDIVAREAGFVGSL
jgi:hypothetical protein